MFKRVKIRKIKNNSLKRNKKILVQSKKFRKSKNKIKKKLLNIIKSFRLLKKKLMLFKNNKI